MFDFPSSPTNGQIYSGYIYSSATGGWLQNAPAPTPGIPTVSTAQARSRVCNGAMQISQENGNAASTASGYYPADQWYEAFGTTAVVSTQRVQAVTPNGSKDRLRFSVTTADASMGAGEFFMILQPIEGSRFADFRYGSVSAKQSILRFGWKSPAGTYSVCLRNGANNRSYIANFTVSAGQANTDTEQTFVIPGDVTGTWLTDNGVGMQLGIVLATGTTFQGAAGWQAGNILGTSATSNGLAATGRVYELFDVGWYLDPQLTGLAPAWVLPDEADELTACQRYWWCSNPTAPKGAAQGSLVGNSLVANYIGLGNWRFTVPMRIVPTVAIWTNGVQNQVRIITTGAFPATGAITSQIGISSGGGTNINVTSFAAGSWVDFDLTANARM